MKHIKLTITSLLLFAAISGTVFGQTVAEIHKHQEISMRIFGDEDDGTPREDQAEVNIKAPTKVKVGDAIFLDLSESIGGGFDYTVEPMPPGLRTFDGGKIIVCGTGNKNVTYTFMVSCALAGDSDIKVHKIKVTGAASGPVSPDSSMTMVEKVMEWADLVESPTKRDDAMKLAQSFASVAIIIDQGTFTTAEEIVRATATSNREALNGNLSHWAPFLDNLMRELAAMAKAGQLPEAKSHAGVWKDVAQGLKEYASTI